MMQLQDFPWFFFIGGPVYYVSLLLENWDLIGYDKWVRKDPSYGSNYNYAAKILVCYSRKAMWTWERIHRCDIAVIL